MSLKLKVLSFLPFSLTVALKNRIIFHSKSPKFNGDIIDIKSVSLMLIFHLNKLN